LTRHGRLQYTFAVATVVTLAELAALERLDPERVRYRLG
jgi:hypothetical protein